MNRKLIGRHRINLKIFASIACLLFAYSAVIQWNDPDPIRWFSIYATAALLSGFSLFIRVPGSMFAILATVAGLWAAILLPSVLSAGSFTGTEEEREFAGLSLVAIASVVQLLLPEARE